MTPAASVESELETEFIGSCLYLAGGELGPLSASFSLFLHLHYEWTLLTTSRINMGLSNLNRKETRSKVRDREDLKGATFGWR